MDRIEYDLREIKWLLLLIAVLLLGILILTGLPLLLDALEGEPQVEGLLAILLQVR